MLMRAGIGYLVVVAIVVAWAILQLSGLAHSGIGV